MRAVVQKVTQASVAVDGNTKGSIREGLLVFLGVGKGDSEKDAAYLAEKIANLRIFEDEEGKMNLSVLQKSKAILSISQFTLYGDVRKGRRPAFDGAMAPQEAKALYEYFNEKARELGLHVETGVFQAHMEVSLINDGPVTILLDSNKDF